MQTTPVYKNIVPPEAHALAREFRQARERVLDLVRQMESLQRRLDDTWDGNAWERYKGEHEASIRELRWYADWLGRSADEISRIQVRVKV